MKDSGNSARCLACGAALTGTESCEAFFHQMLFWENEFSELGAVHHLAVLCYHLQHPHLYSPAGLKAAVGLLESFVEAGASTPEVRRRSRAHLDSGRRSWKITARRGDEGAYPSPVSWQTTAPDIIAAGPDCYIDTVRHWAVCCLQDLRAAGISTLTMP